MATALANTNPAPHAARALIVADALDQEAEQRKLLGQYIAKHMQEGTDYGVIPGTKNRTLLKPGAEKLTQLFRCIPRFTIEEKIENWDTGLFFYRFGCQIVTQADEAVVAEGVGSCSTYESRYRWREAGRKCPACGKETIIKGKKEYGGGWLCFGKKGGCGAKFADDDESITSQQTGRVQNPDLHDAANTVLKMAKKRALVDAAIALARCSDIFTQDLDELLEAESPAPQPRAGQGQPANAGPDEMIDGKFPLRRAKLDELLAASSAAGMGREWGQLMTWLQSAYPGTQPPYTKTTRPQDIEPERLDHLIRHLQSFQRAS